MRHLTFLGLCLISFLACAAPPYTAEITITIPVVAGPVEGIRLYFDCDPTMGTCTEFASLVDLENELGVPFTYPDLITTDGSHTLWAEAFNDSEMLSTFSEPLVFSTTEILAPGKPEIQIQVDCEPCIFTVQ